MLPLKNEFRNNNNKFYINEFKNEREYYMDFTQVTQTNMLHVNEYLHINTHVNKLHKVLKKPFDKISFIYVLIFIL